MAVAVGSYSLKSKKFPSEFENVFVPRILSPNEKVQSDADRRVLFGKLDEYPGIGLLRMEFNGVRLYGTATMIANGRCVLTCAHNVVEYDPTTKEFVMASFVWFELRKHQAGSESALNKRYDVTKINVYPRYFQDSKPESGFDLALCWINAEHDQTVKEFYSEYEMPIPQVRNYAANSAGVVGFPAEHEGEKWGMVATIPEENSKDWIPDRNREILVYPFIDTSEGQSGSPVMGETPSEILGVHSGGSTALKKNWGAAITATKLKWIANTLGRPWRVGKDDKSFHLCAA